jgi:hypothetical protein
MILGFRVSNIPNIVLLCETEEAANLRGTLGTEAFRLDGVGETWNVLLALLDERECEDGEILSNNAATNGLALALTGTARAIA